MFCTKCGTQFADGSAFCPNCGAPVNAAPQQPQYQQPAPAGDFVAQLKPIMHFIVLGVAIFAFLMFFLNTFQILDMPVTASYGSNDNTEYTSVSDIAEGFDSMNDSFFFGYIANIICGLASMAAAAVGILYFLKQQMNMPYYDQIIGNIVKGIGPGTVMGVVGFAGCVLQFILLLFVGIDFMGAEISVSVPWLTWVALVLYAALAALDFFVINKKK